MTTVAMATIVSTLRTRSCSSPQSWRVREREIGKDQRTGGIKRGKARAGTAGERGR